MKRSFILGTLSIGIITFLLVACCCPPSKTDKDKKKEEIKTVEVNEDLTVGEVRWKVLEVSKSATIERAYTEPLEANGVFIILKLEAELIGKESGSISGSQLRIVDSKNRTFSTSTEGEFALPLEKEKLLFETVQPNVPVVGYTVFDIAKDAIGLKLKIEDLRLMSDEYGFVELGI